MTISKFAPDDRLKMVDTVFRQSHNVARKKEMEELSHRGSFSEGSRLSVQSCISTVHFLAVEISQPARFLTLNNSTKHASMVKSEL